MFCLIYKFEVHSDMEDIFKRGWHALTYELVEKNGSLGARLHRASDGSWISYAQWPDRQTWMQGEEVVAKFLKGNHWKDCLSGEVVRLLDMEMTDDLLQFPVREK